MRGWQMVVGITMLAAVSAAVAQTPPRVEALTPTRAGGATTRVIFTFQGERGGGFTAGDNTAQQCFEGVCVSVHARQSDRGPGMFLYMRFSSERYWCGTVGAHLAGSRPELRTVRMQPGGRGESDVFFPPRQGPVFVVMDKEPDDQC